MAAVWSLLTFLYRPIHLPKCFLDAYASISVSTAQKPTTYFSTPHIAGTSVGEILELQVNSFYVFCCSMFIWGAGAPKQYPLCRLLYAFTWMLACAAASQREIMLTLRSLLQVEWGYSWLFFLCYTSWVLANVMTMSLNYFWKCDKNTVWSLLYYCLPEILGRLWSLSTTTIRVWWSQWGVMADSQRNLWWRWWSYTLV